MAEENNTKKTNIEENNTENDDMITRMQRLLNEPFTEEYVEDNAKDESTLTQMSKRQELEGQEVEESEIITEVLLSGDNVFIAPPVDYPQVPVTEMTDAQWLHSLPSPKDGEFIVEVGEVGIQVVACVKELEWHVSQDIEARAFRRSEDEKIYFAGEYERRETLRHALVWVSDVSSRRVSYNGGGTILRHLTQAVVDAIWEKYYPLITLAADEANALYAAAVKYFRGEAQQGYPVPPLVVEVDYLLAFGMSRAELRAVKQSEMERIQLIRMARKDALIPHALPQSQSSSHDKSLISTTEEEMEMPASMFPPGWGPTGRA